MNARDIFSKIIISQGIDGIEKQSLKLQPPREEEPPEE